MDVGVMKLNWETPFGESSLYPRYILMTEGVPELQLLFLRLNLNLVMRL